MLANVLLDPVCVCARKSAWKYLQVLMSKNPVPWCISTHTKAGLQIAGWVYYL